MSNLHLYLLDKIRHEIKLDVTDEKILLRYIFKNYRFHNEQHKGLCLSYNGNKIMQKHFESYSYPIARKIMHLSTIALDKNMLWPYYIGKQYVTFYSADDASWFQLNGKDLNSFSNYI